ncbi:MAG: ParB N-terminal domain-containing protein [Nitrososphaeria archaeon]|nr:ParB N-terminal domain-containing protein [Nitrososphaeria archaeon]
MVDYHNIHKLLKAKVEILDVGLLRQHERVDERRLAELYEEIRVDGLIKKAVAADLNTYIIIDGHHRYNVLKSLGCKRIPAILVDYFSPILKVYSWNSNGKISKSSVIEAGVSGKLFPAKTTKHMIYFGGRKFHISLLEPEVNI